MEIEGWARLEPTSQICLNFNCPCEQQRVVAPTDQSHFKTCKEHIRRISQLRKYDMPKIMEVLNCNMEGMEFDFVRAPIQSLKLIHGMARMNWKSTHSHYFKVIKQEILNELAEIEKESLAKLADFVGLADHYEQILKVVEYPKSLAHFSEHLTDEMHLIQQQMDTLSYKTIFNQRKIKDCVTAVKENLRVLDGCILSEEKLVAVAPSSNSQNDEALFKEFFNEETDNILGKVQALAAACGSTVSSYSVKESRTSLDCFLCRQCFQEAGESSSKKLMKRSIAQKLIDHLKKVHYEEVLKGYRLRILKSFVKEMSLEEIVREVRESKYTEVEIIDRENAGSYECTDDTKYVLEVISHRNSNLAKGRYLLAKSSGKDAADILTIFAVKELFNIRALSVRLVTNDHFGNTLKEICDFFRYKLEIVNLKDRK